ncbi:AEC family transporter [Emcibacter sp.]|uniref:AEC family transporter n=1 Tax=Emcibacter sp. TaxID=1979954 RepID=UPI002AA78696|nr:AEC family transporter [Emcibacter sp.]
MFAELFAVTAPVFLIALLGFTWVKRGQKFPTDFVSVMNMNIGAPALVFNGLLGLGDKLFEASDFILASAVTIVAMLALSTLVALALRLPKRGFIIALYSTNSGNMGLPLCLFAFGQIGLGLGLTFFAVSVIFQFTVALFISHGNLRPASLARVSLIWGIAFALFFILTGITPPAWVTNTTQLLGGLTIPLMLLTLGASLATLKVENSGQLIALSALKIAMGVGMGLGVATLFGFSGVERNVLILQCSMPVAVFSYLLASQYNRNPQEVAAMVFFTTLMSVVTVPLILTYML